MTYFLNIAQFFKKQNLVYNDFLYQKDNRISIHVEIVLISYVRFWMYFKRRNHIVSMKIFISCSSTQNMYLTACCYVSRNNLNYSSVGQHVHSCLSNAILQKPLQHLMHFFRQYFIFFTYIRRQKQICQTFKNSKKYIHFVNLGLNILWQTIWNESFIIFTMKQCHSKQYVTHSRYYNIRFFKFHKYLKTSSFQQIQN